MQKRVRMAREDDAGFLPDVERSAGEVFRTIPELAWIADEAVTSADDHLASIRGGAVWVAVDESDQAAGFLSAERCGDELHIWELAVRRDAQGQGLGRALVQATVAYAREYALSGVTLTTFRDVPWNEAFYGRLGFDTLTADTMGNRLAEVLRLEVDQGLPAERRCAMRRRMSRKV